MKPTACINVFVYLCVSLSCAADAARWIAPTTSDDGVSQPSPMWVWVARPSTLAATQAEEPIGQVYLSRSFDVPSAVRAGAAHLALAADNHAVAYLNGVEVLRSDDWSRPTRAEITLQAGQNTLAVFAENGEAAGENPAGVIAVLEAPLERWRVSLGDR